MPSAFAVFRLIVSSNSSAIRPEGRLELRPLKFCQRNPQHDGTLCGLSMLQDINAFIARDQSLLMQEVATA
jgi:hypothetical protein